MEDGGQAEAVASTDGLPCLPPPAGDQRGISGENHDKPTSANAASWFDFGEEERLLIEMPRLLSTTQRAVLALHYERFQTREIAEILGMKPARVRRNLTGASATLEASLNLDDNPWTDQDRLRGTRLRGRGGDMSHIDDEGAVAVAPGGDQVTRRWTLHSRQPTPAWSPRSARASTSMRASPVSSGPRPRWRFVPQGHPKGATGGGCCPPPPGPMVAGHGWIRTFARSMSVLKSHACGFASWSLCGGARQAGLPRCC